MKIRNAAEIYLSKWPKKSDSYKTMLGALERIAHALDGDSALEFAWHELRYEDVRAVPALLTDAGLAVRTINKCLSALRGVLEAAWRAGQLPDEEYRRIKIENVRGATPAAGRALTDEELVLFETALAKATPRDAALLTILFACGLRRVEIAGRDGEAIGMRGSDYDPATGRLRAVGKGNKVRFVTVEETYRPYVNAHWATILHPDACAFRGSHGALSRRGVSYIVEQFCLGSGIKHFTPHDLRRTFGTVLLKRGVPISVVQRLMGHASIAVTALYDKSGEDAEREAVSVLAMRKKPEAPTPE